MASTMKERAPALYERIKDGSVSALLLRPELVEHEDSAALMGKLEELLGRNGFSVVARHDVLQKKEFIDSHYKGASESALMSKLAESGMKRLLYALLYQIEHNKDDLEGRFTKIKGIGNAEEAKAVIEKASAK